MKKYILFLFVLVFVFGLFNINVNSASAMRNQPTCVQFECGELNGVSTTDLMCFWDDGHFSWASYGCSDDDNDYWPYTSVKKDLKFTRAIKAGSSGDDVLFFQKLLNANKYDVGIPDGKFGPKTTAAVIAFQEKNGLAPDGIFGLKSRIAIIKESSFLVSDLTTSGCISAYGYSATTGAKCAPLPPVPAPTSTDLPAGCTSTAGYSPTTGMPCDGSNPNPTPTPTTLPAGCTSTAGFSSTTSTPCNETGVNPPPTKSTVTVLSPNGGENWVKGTTQTINWTDSNNISTHEVKLVPYYPPCTSKICPSYPYHAPYTITNTQGSSYSWTVGQTWESASVLDGSYTIQVCQSSSSNCDSSNAPFSIRSGNVQLPSISGLSPNSGPAQTQVTITGSNFAPTGNIIYFGTTGNTYSSNSTNGTTLVFNVPTYSSSTGAPLAPGVYGVYVTNANGTSNVVNFTLTSSGTSTITVSSPNGGEQWKVGETHDITWTTNNLNTVTDGYATIVLTGGPSSVPPLTLAHVNTVSGRYTWTIPQTVPPAAYKIRIYTSGNLDVTGNTFTITSGTTNPSVSVYPTNSTTDYNAGSMSAAFSVTSNTSWTVSSNQSWVKLNKINGTGNSTVGFSYLANTSTVGRTALITVAAGDHTAVYTFKQGGTGDGTGGGGTGDIMPIVLGAESFTFTQLLKLGSNGNEVTELQKFLNGNGYDAGMADGKFGAKTKAAVIKFQIAKGLTSDGIVGPAVRAVLNQ